MSFKYWKTLAVVAVLATGAAAYVFYQAGGLNFLFPTQSVSPAFPGQSKEVFELRDEDTGEFYRKKWLGGTTGQTVVKMEIAYRDGVLAWHDFTADGVLQQVKEVYVLESGAHKQRSHKQYSADGKRVVYADLWRLDGSLSITVRGDGVGGTTYTRYFTDGKTVADLRKSNEVGKLVFRQQFRENGRKAAVYTALDDGSEEESTYHEDGETVKHHQVVRDGDTVLDELFAANGFPVKRILREPGKTIREQFHANGKLAVSRVESGPYGGSETSFFREDGKTLRLKHTSTWGRDAAQYFDAAGKLTVERLFFSNGDMEVATFDAAGKMSTVQTYTFTRDWSDPWGAGKTHLSSVVTYWPGGEKVKLRLSLAHDGKTVLEARDYYQDDTSTRKSMRVYRGDGSQVTGETFNDKGHLVERRLYRDNGSVELVLTYDGSKDEVLLKRKSSRPDNTTDKVELFTDKGVLETVRTCDKDGKCEKIETFDKDGKVTKTDKGDDKVEPAEPTGHPEVVPAELLQRLEFEDPRNFKMDP